MFIVLYTKINTSKTYKKVICLPKLSKASCYPLKECLNKYICHTTNLMEFAAL